MRHIAFIACVAMAPLAAMAEQSCASLKDNTARLACYDTMTEASTAADAAAAEAEAKYKAEADAKAARDGLATPEQIAQLCTNLGEVSSALLAARDAGIPLSKAMEYTKESMARYMDLAKPIVLEAYGLPNFSTAEHKKRQVIEFRNKTEGDCYAKFP